MDKEESKEPSRRIPLTQLEQVHSDFALAITLQEQERALAMLTTIESTSEEEDESDVSDDTEIFESQDVQDELEFLEEEEEDSNSDEDDLDLDELSYEEMIAVEEFIGEEKRGLSINEIPTCLSPCKYQSVKSKTGVDRCVICQVEYGEGENLVALPCEHPYHAECISKWLQIKRICPICSTEVSPPKVLPPSS